MTAGSECAPAQERGVALNDVSVAQIRNPSPEMSRALTAALFPTAEDKVDRKAYEEYMRQLMRNGFVIGVTLATEQDNSLVGAFLLGEDPHDSRATTISYGRVNDGDRKTKGAMTAAGLKVTETILRKNKIADRGRRKELRASGQWEQERAAQEAQLAAKPIRAYVDVNNIASQRMLERMGYVKTGTITEGNQEYVYELKLDAFDDAIDNFGLR